MNWLDIIIAIVLVIGIVIGLKAGLIKMVISFAGLILAIFLAGRFYVALADKLTFISSVQVARIVAYIIIFIVVMLVAALVAWILTKLASTILLGWLNRLVGAVIGLLVGAIFCGAILAIWVKYSSSGGDVISGSFLGRFLLNTFPLVLALLPGEFDTIRLFFN
jgi:membrane protein required for colicin V production